MHIYHRYSDAPVNGLYQREVLGKPTGFDNYLREIVPKFQIPCLHVRKQILCDEFI